MHIFLGLWNGNEELKKILTATADIYIADFYCARRSMLFAPSTIAVCSIISSFSTLRMDCTDWLDCVPDRCLRRSGNDVYNSLLNIDKCLDIFERIERVHRRNKSQVYSPTSIACSSEDMEVVTDLASQKEVTYKNENELNGLGTLDLASIEEDCSLPSILN